MTEIPHPNDDRLIFSVIIHENSLENIRGRDGIMHNNPANHLTHEINGAAWFDGEKTVDVTDFVNEYAPHLFQKWEKELSEHAI